MLISTLPTCILKQTAPAKTPKNSAASCHRVPRCFREAGFSRSRPSLVNPHFAYPNDLKWTRSQGC